MLKTIQFKENGGALKVQVLFSGDINAAYSLKLSEKNSNTAVLMKDGDNLNTEDDAYLLPEPANINDGRILRLMFDFDARNPGTSSQYQVGISVFQDGRELGGHHVAGTLTGKKQDVMMFVMLVAAPNH